MNWSVETQARSFKPSSSHWKLAYLAENIPREPLARLSINTVSLIAEIATGSFPARNILCEIIRFIREKGYVVGVLSEVP